VGSESHACNDDGTIGALLADCAPSACVGGQCEDNCAAGGVKLIYVIDNTHELWSFNPADNYALTKIGTVSCPSTFGAGVTPFSMSVDRNARAWVLYSSGELFQVSTADASCSRTDFEAGQAGYEVFGMGFVTKTSGSNDEILYIASGSTSSLGGSASSSLAEIDPGSLELTTVGELPTGDQSPELTGTGDAQLYAYYPGAQNSFIARIDKTTGESTKTWPLPALTGSVSAWAFAHWGGKFYVFVTTGGVLESNSQIIEFDPQSGKSVPIRDHLPSEIVGAGVSTCAPLVIE
jgi:hypothetical protein